MAVKVDKSKCDGCGMCAEVCPVEAVAVGQKAKVDADICIDCGACVDECPNGAISMPEIEIASYTRNLYSEPSPPMPSNQNGSNPNTLWTSAGQSGANQTNKGGLLGQVFDFFGKSAGQGRGRNKGGGGKGGGGKGGYGKGRHGK